ncbi:proline-rich small protein YnaL [Salmonella enterica]|uniref:proline-rich small protein YnaL n=1 Tax=Salmonella enterica TaxID=28901 RepID=UPI00403886FF
MSCLLTLLYLHSSLSDPVPIPEPLPRPQPMPDPPPDEEPIKMSHQTPGSARIRAC